MKTQILKQHIDYLDPDDWDERPEYICKKCGYKVCICQLKSYKPAKNSSFKINQYVL